MKLLLIIFSISFCFIQIDSFSQSTDNEKMENMVKRMTDSINLHPENANFYLLRGVGYAGLERFTDALDDLNECILLNSTIPEAYYYRGCVFQRQNKLDFAIRDFSRVIAIAPRYLKAYFNRAEIYDRLSQPDMALQDYFAILAIDKTNSSAYSEFKLIYLKKSLEFWKIVEINSRHAALNAENQADSTFQKTVFKKAVDPKVLAVRRNEEKEQAKQLLSILTTVITKCPSTSFAYVERANIYKQQQQFELALKDYSKALSIEPDNVDAKNGLKELENRPTSKKK